MNQQPAKRCRFSSTTPNDNLPTTAMRTTNVERATLKIEIPFTDHAHCIGRQGNQIQSIMSATDTHIHFPDGNREPNGTKSNQVSITGTIGSIEEARKRIREILPMSLKFLIPPTQLINIINDDYPLFKTVRSRYGVIVLPRPYAKTGDVYCIVRGLINQPGLAEATEYLIQAFYGFESPLVKVTCQTEVSEQYHVYLQTRQQSKDMCIASIEQYTHTTIQFPTMLNANLVQENGNNYGRRTSVTITGSPSQVCQARKLFDLCLPIILTFEISSDKEPTRAQIAHVKDKLNVTTTIRTRKDKIGKYITVQTQEYNSDHLFQARALILGLTEAATNQILPIRTNGFFDLSKTSENVFSTSFLPDLSVSSSTSSSLLLTSPANSSASHLTESILIPIESCYIPSGQSIDTVLVPIIEPTPTKKPSPIGHERSSLRNVEHENLFWSTNPNSIPPLLLFDPSTPKTTEINPVESLDNSLNLPHQDNCSSKLFTLLRSMNLERYWSIFERNEIDYLTFLSMTEQDLTQIGINSIQQSLTSSTCYNPFGIRRRLQQAIADQTMANFPRY